MASKAQAKQEPAAPAARDEAGEAPLLDGVDASVKKLVARAKEVGYVTEDEVAEALPPDRVSSDVVEDVLSKLSEMGVNVIEGDDGDTDDDNAEKPTGDSATSTSRSGNVSDDDVGRTDDPVRMYLREMGSVELLSREGEIAIAKRIEAGREKMIGAICESPLTMQAIISWRDALVGQKMLLRDIIDLEVTFGGGPVTADNDDQDQNGADGAAGANGADQDAAAKANGEGAQSRNGAASRANGEAADDDDESADGENASGDNEDDDDDETNLSLAAKEATLMPDVLGTFDSIAGTYKKLAKIQDQR
ncbi:MAG: RNA polymerase sigma factor RpoD, partial [Alphaproteobacteria bacterium]|nr:RNA polymerase sigma factor RpoD [Alphaproteobacteria bacterium]